VSDRQNDKQTVLTSQAVTAATNSSAFYVGDYTEALVILSVTAVSGTAPTLSPVVETSYDGDVTFATLAGGSTWVEQDATTVTQITDGTNISGDGTGRYLCAVTNIGLSIRVRMPLPGGTTPSFTMSIIIVAKN